MEKPNSSAAGHPPSRWLALGVLFLAALAVIAVRVRLLEIPLERDEGEYAYVGQLILQGVPPYQLACNMKMPGIYLAYAAIMSIFGQTSAGIHLGLLLVNLANMVVLFFVARIFLDLYGAVMASAAYGIMALSQAYLGLAAHATNFAVLPALLGMWLLLRLKVNQGLPACFAAGFLFGVSFIMFETGAFVGFWGGLYVLWLAMAEKNGWRKAAALPGIYALGWVTPLLAVCLWLKMAGVFPQFWYWTFTYSREYATAVSFDLGLRNASQALVEIFNYNSLLYLAAALGLVCLCFRVMTLNSRVFLFGLLFFSLLAVCPGFYFREHYFIVLLPVVALLAGLAVSSVARWLAREYHRPVFFHLAFLAGAVACAQGLYADKTVFFRLSPWQTCHAIYLANPFPESLDVARYIEQHSQKDQRVFVFGDEPQIYFYAHRRSCNTQIYPSQLMNPRPYAHGMQEKMISEIKQNPPEFIVRSSVWASLLIRDNSDPTLMDWVQDYQKQNMQLVGLVQFDTGRILATNWGTDAESAPIVCDHYLSVYQRLAPAGGQTKEADGP